MESIKEYSKYIFRDIASEVIPESWSKRKKWGFPVPFGKWIKEEKYYKKVKKIFNTKYAKEFFKISEINKLLDDHYNNKSSNGKKIYTIYTFLIWYKRFFIDE